LIIRNALLLAVEFIKISIAFMVAWLNSLWLVPLAAAERGYTGAYGGEWLLIIGFFIFTYWIATKAIHRALSPETAP